MNDAFIFSIDSSCKPTSICVFACKDGHTLRRIRHITQCLVEKQRLRHRSGHHQQAHTSSAGNKLHTRAFTQRQAAAAAATFTTHRPSAGHGVDPVQRRDKRTELARSFLLTLASVSALVTELARPRTFCSGVTCKGITLQLTLAPQKEREALQSKYSRKSRS